MTDLPLLLTFWAAFTLALLSPGPNFAVILATAVEEGRPSAVRTALGMVAGEAVWGFGAVFGIAALAAQHPWIASALAWGGGTVLLLLAARSLRAALRPATALPDAPGAPPPRIGAEAGRPRGFLRGFGLMLLNPKAGVFWLSLTGVFLAARETEGTGVVAVAGACVISAAWHLALAHALTTGLALRLYRRARRWLEGALGVVLAGLGIRLLVAG